MFISFIRAIILYFLIIICLRLTGKRQMGDLEPSELVVTFMISELAAVPMQDAGIPILSGVIPILTLISLELLISALSMKSVGFRALMCGRPTVVISNGKILQSAMKKTRLTLDELSECLRKQGVLDISTVQYAIMETDGQLSVILSPLESPPTAKLMKLQPQKLSLPVMVINDGRLMKENLALLGLDTGWVESQLASHGVKSVQEVYLLSSDRNGTIIFEKKEG